MLAFAVKRLGVALLVALTVSLITFSMIYVSGDPAIAIAGEGARPETIEAIRKFYGFDRPIIVQYLDWLAGAVRGDFGRSYHAAPAGRRRDLRAPAGHHGAGRARPSPSRCCWPFRSACSRPCAPTASSTASR